MRARVVGGRDEAPVHVGVAARLVAQLAPQRVEWVGGRCEDRRAPGCDGGVGGEGGGGQFGDDSEGLAGCVPVRGADGGCCGHGGVGWLMLGMDLCDGRGVEGVRWGRDEMDWVGLS